MEQFHPFLLSPGHWLGEGKITFNYSPDQLRFYLRWIVTHEQETIRATQEIMLIGLEETILNTMTLNKNEAEAFEISLENSIVGIVKGKGVISEKTIGWEFRGQKAFEGFEIYTLQESGQYHFHAEYFSEDGYRSITDGHIWKKDEG